MIPVIFGCSGLTLTDDEHSLFRASDPFGFILFQRNCASPDQVRALTTTLRQATGRAETPIFIDQEGGRVARLKPPHWPALPALRTFGRLFEEGQEPKALEALTLHTRLTAHMLRDLGITGNCSPVLDLLIDGASDVLGDRAFSHTPAVIAKLGRHVVDTFLENGIFPVIKHLPGHGRVKVDPHHTLPFVDTPYDVLEREDFAPFIAMHDTPMGMNCHVVFNALDPENPVSMSAKVHREILRGTLKFKGLIMSDDLAMKALNGPPADLACRTLAAGADLALHCPGTLDDMKAIAASVPLLSSETRARWTRAQNMILPPAQPEFVFEDGLAQLQGLCGPLDKV